MVRRGSVRSLSEAATRWRAGRRPARRAGRRRRTADGTAVDDRDVLHRTGRHRPAVPVPRTDAAAVRPTDEGGLGAPAAERGRPARDRVHLPPHDPHRPARTGLEALRGRPRWHRDPHRSQRRARHVEHVCPARGRCIRVRGARHGHPGVRGLGGQLPERRVSRHHVQGHRSRSGATSPHGPGRRHPHRHRHVRGDRPQDEPGDPVGLHQRGAPGRRSRRSAAGRFRPGPTCRC